MNEVRREIRPGVASQGGPVRGVCPRSVRILVFGASVTGQVVAFANARPLTALLLTLGVLGGGLLYRAGYRLASR